MGALGRGWPGGAWIIIAPALAVVFALGGCSGGQTQTVPDPSPSTPVPSSVSESPETTAPPSAMETVEPRQKFSLDRQEGESRADQGDGNLPIAIRQAEHDGYTRVVIDLSGGGTPRYIAQYVDSPTADGSGNLIPMRGSAFLQIELFGIREPTEADKPVPLMTDGVNTVEEIYVGNSFEGITRIVVGVEAQVPYRVFTLENPSRVVMDFQEK